MKIEVYDLAASVFFGTVIGLGILLFLNEVRQEYELGKRVEATLKVLKKLARRMRGWTE